MFQMVAKKSFTNARVKNERGNGAVLAGELFETDWLHAKELHQTGIAEPAEGVDLDAEPTELVEGHYQISAPALKEINDRRAAKRGEAPKIVDGGKSK